MRDSCQIVRRAPSGARSYDPVSMTYATAAPTVLYTGKCRVRPRDVLDKVVEAGEEPTSMWTYMVSVPFAAVTDLRADDEVRLTASADASLVSRRLRITAVARGTDITARRLLVVDEENQVPYPPLGRPYPALTRYPSLTFFPAGA